MITVRNRAGLYIRVSLEEQEKYGFSIDGQIDALTKYCDMHRLAVNRQYKDAGLSGKSIKGRPQLERLLEDVKAGKIDTVIVWRLNRLSRSLTDILEIVELFTQYGVSLRSLTEHLDTGSAHGTLVLQMLGATAEFERGQISANVRIGMLERSKQGNWNGGNSVLGYRWVRNESTIIPYVEILEEEAKIVRSIFNMYATGHYGLKAISNLLNSKGYLTKKGMPFGIHSIRYILQNPNYIGMVRYSAYGELFNRHKMVKEWSKGNHLPIIDKALWDQVHSIYAMHSIQPKRIIERKYLLTGLLKCPQCSKSMVPGHAKSIRKDGSIHINHYYVCSAYNAKGPSVCRGNIIRANEIEQWFLHKLQQFLCSSSVLDRIVASAQSKLDVSRAPRQEKLLELRNKLIQLDSRQKESFQSFENGSYSNEQLLLELHEIKYLRQTSLSEQEDMERELISDPDITIPKEKIHAALQQLQQVLKMASFDRQKELLSMLVEKITLPPNRNIHEAVISWKFVRGNI